LKESFKIEDADTEEVKKSKNKINDKAKYIIVSALTDKVLRKVQKDSAKEIWNSLNSKYQNKDAHGINYARRKFFNAIQNDKESVEEFIDRISSMKEELEATGCFFNRNVSSMLNCQ
jgi:hypothetical protein